MHSLPPQVKLEDKPCPMGCPPSDKNILKANDHLHNLPGVFSLVRCAHCGLVRTNPRPTPDTIGYYYPDDYAPHSMSNMGSAIPGPGSANHPSWKLFVRRLFEESRELPPVEPGKLLEIGCATGGFLSRMAGEGWQVEGIELSEQAANIAKERGHSVSISSLEGASDPDAPYDLIVGWMVLEHLHSPVAVLSKLHGWMRDKGWMVLSIPDISPFEFRYFRDYWYPLQMPTHLYHYSPETLKNMLDKAGWSLERVIWHKNSDNTWHSFRYMFEDKGYERISAYFSDIADGKRHRYLKMLASIVAGALHQSGRITVWARKA